MCDDLEALKSAARTRLLLLDILFATNWIQNDGRTLALADDVPGYLRDRIKAELLLREEDTRCGS
jgi:hypothetical protein